MSSILPLQITHPPREEQTLTWSYGGGVQSVALAVLIAQGKLPRPEAIVIADTGREASATWEYLEKHVAPLLAMIGLTVAVAPHTLATVDLYGFNGDLLMPTYTHAGKMPTLCSTEWKQRVVRRWLRDQGYGPTRPIVTWIGISLDEIGRAKSSDVAWQEYDHPLLLPMRFRRRDCLASIAAAGLPPPPKSSCWMCPHRRNDQWRELRDFWPEDFEKACQLDEAVRANDKKGGLYLHDSRLPLREANLDIEESRQPSLFGDVDGCDSGFCWT